MSRPDPFDILGLPPRFDLTPPEIRTAHLSRVARLHPDAAGSDDEAAAVNDARKILEDPESRARALLARLGPNAPDADALPDGFLMEIMEIREAMESAADLERFETLAASRRAAHVDRIDQLFRACGPSPSSERLAEIRKELNAWRYTERMIEQLDQP